MSKAIDTGLLVRPPSDVGALLSTDRVLINRSGNSASTTVGLLSSISGIQQVIQQSTTTEINHTSTTYVDVISANITVRNPSSKILVSIHQSVFTGQDTGYGFRIVRDSTTLYTATSGVTNSGVSFTGGNINVVLANYISFQFVDFGPFTANQTYTYKGRANRIVGGNICYSNYNNDATSLIQLLEII